MDPATIEQRWKGVCRNQGVWEGNISRYDPDGNLKSRQPTVLFIYPSGPSDKAKVALGEVPAHLTVRLHRVTEGKNAVFNGFSPTHRILSGAAYDPATGSYSQGDHDLVGSQAGEVACEFGINNLGPDGRIQGRVRLLITFSAEHLKRISLFRERPGNQAVDTAKPVVPVDICESDTVSTSAEVNPAALCGLWRVETTNFTAAGEKMTSHEEVAVESRAMDGQCMKVDRDGVQGYGEVSDNGKAMVLRMDGCAERRMLFFPGGVTVVHTVAIPKVSEDFYVELGWLVESGLRFVVARRYIGATWVGSSFSVETRE